MIFLGKKAYFLKYKNFLEVDFFKFVLAKA